MIKSVITIYSRGWNDTEEMLIPICIGEVKKGYSSRQRIDRMLPVGHRRRGYEE